MDEEASGGPAFPSGPASGNWGIAFTGMSLRDYFAGQALMILFAFYATVEHDRIAADAYQLADAMLEARGAKP